MSIDGPQVGINECLYELSKDLKGELILGQASEEKCEKLDCVSFKTPSFHLYSHIGLKSKSR
jgi:hypothetical protein